VLYRDDGEVLGCVLRLEGDPSIYAHTLTRDALRRLGVHPTVAAAGARSSGRSAPGWAPREPPGVGPLFDHDAPRASFILIQFALRPER
jgi:hypothetical protein